jgi:hypothetical protein
MKLNKEQQDLHNDLKKLKQVTLNRKNQALLDSLKKIEDYNEHFEKLKIELNSKLKTIHDAKIDLEFRENRLEYRDKDIDNKSEKRFKELKEAENGIKILIKEKTKSFPWLTNVIADYLKLKDEKLAEYLITKKNPAPSSAEIVKEISIEKRILTQQLLLTRYRLKYYESLFPFLKDFNDENIDDLLVQIIQEHEKTTSEPENDPVKKYLTQGEFENLSTLERNQKALDRYLNSAKTPYQIGRDYERYIGYKYELMGYQVTYHGIEEGIYDLGRDLICRKGDQIEIVQCKCWSKHKTIHEKHINQLFGTTVKYYIDFFAEGKGLNKKLSALPNMLQEGKIKSVFYTSTTLSETAKKFAAALGMEIHEEETLKPYPTIKCHTNKQTEEKIYHLPFDQMYDRTIIEKKYGEFYAMNVAEAESKGFRRAWKWTGNL